MTSLKNVFELYTSLKEYRGGCLKFFLVKNLSVDVEKLKQIIHFDTLLDNAYL